MTNNKYKYRPIRVACKFITDRIIKHDLYSLLFWYLEGNDNKNPLGRGKLWQEVAIIGSLFNKLDKTREKNCSVSNVELMIYMAMMDEAWEYIADPKDEGTCLKPIQGKLRNYYKKNFGEKQPSYILKTLRYNSQCNEFIASFIINEDNLTNSYSH